MSHETAPKDRGWQVFQNNACKGAASLRDWREWGCWSIRIVVLALGMGATLRSPPVAAVSGIPVGCALSGFTCTCANRSQPTKKGDPKAARIPHHHKAQLPVALSTATVTPGPMVELSAIFFM
jgi:hypothetical protein